MLSLANTVSSSGSAHEQLYSLLLDGDSDYLQLQSSFSNPKISISAWIYNNTETGTKCIFSNRNSGVGTSRGILFYVSSKTLKVKCQDVGIQASAGGAYNNWVHACMTFDPSAASNQLKLYENGSLASQATCTTAHDDTVWGNAKIGQGNVTDYYFPGNINDVAIWDEALDADAVAAVYNSGKPFNLNNNRGSYDNSSDLIAYYRMGNGPFDDKENGVVHTAHNPGFETEVTINPTFDDTTNIGSAGSGWFDDTGGTSTIEYHNGGVKLTRSGGICKLRVRDASNSSAVMTAGKTYKLVYEVIENNSAIIRYHNGSNSSAISSTVGTHIIYFVQESGNTFHIENFNDATNITLDNVHVTPLNDYPGLTAATATFDTNTPED